MCIPYEHHRGWHWDGHAFGCTCGPHFHRRFLSSKEKTTQLKEYRDVLKAEVAEVEKRIEELEKENKKQNLTYIVVPCFLKDRPFRLWWDGPAAQAIRESWEIILQYLVNEKSVESLYQKEA